MISANYLGNDTFEYILDGKTVELSDDDILAIIEARKNKLKNGFRSNTFDFDEIDNIEELYDE